MPSSGRGEVAAGSSFVVVASSDSWADAGASRVAPFGSRPRGGRTVPEVDWDAAVRADGRPVLAVVLRACSVLAADAVRFGCSALPAEAARFRGAGFATAPAAAAASLPADRVDGRRAVLSAPSPVFAVELRDRVAGFAEPSAAAVPRLRGARGFEAPGGGGPCSGTDPSTVGASAAAVEAG